MSRIARGEAPEYLSGTANLSQEQLLQLLHKLRKYSIYLPIEVRARSLGGPLHVIDLIKASAS